MSVFNERDGKRRRAALRKLWIADGVLWTAAGTYIGYKSIDSAAAETLRNYPEYDFFFVGEVDEIPDVARMRWSFGSAVNSPALSGLDIIVTSYGRIVAMYRFHDGAEL